MIRPYSPADLDDVQDVWYAASLIAHPFLSEEFLATERQEIADQWLPIADTIVYEQGGAVVGFLALIETEVGAIFVRPEHQGVGIGRTLMDHARASRPFLELDVFEANPIGRRFYAAYGFRQVGRNVNEDAGQTQLRLRLD